MGQALKTGQELRQYKGIVIIAASPVRQASLICVLDICVRYVHIPPTTYLAIPHTVEVQGHVVKVLLFTMHLHNTTKRIVNSLKTTIFDASPNQWETTTLLKFPTT